MGVDMQTAKTLNDLKNNCVHMLLKTKDKISTHVKLTDEGYWIYCPYHTLAKQNDTWHKLEIR